MTLVSQHRFSLEELRTIVAPVAEKYGVDRVYLFGSVARGDYSENSDYDFCIEPGKIRSLFIYAEFFLDLRDAIGAEIDLVNTNSVDSEFLKNIMSDGVLIYEG